jgi:hypothetical protein
LRVDGHDILNNRLNGTCVEVIGHRIVIGGVAMMMKSAPLKTER